MTTTPEQLAEIQDKYAQANTRLNSIISETESRNSDLSRTNKDIQIKEKMLRTLTEETDGLQIKYDSLSKEYSDLVDQRDLALGEVSKSNESLATTKQQISDHLVEVSKADSELESKKQVLDLKAQELAEKDSALSAKQAQVKESTALIISHLNEHIKNIQ